MNKQTLELIRQDIYKREHYTYLNVSLVNPTENNQIIEAKFETVTDIDVLEDPRAYCVAIVTFSIPANSTPIFKFKDNMYRITLSYLGIDFSEYLTFVSYSIYDIKEKYVFYIQQFLDSINNSFNNLFALLIAAFPGVVNAAPYIVYQFGKFSLICDGLNYNSLLANPVQIFFNQLLFDFFIPMQALTFSLNAPNFKDVQILVKDNGVGSETGSLNGTIFTITTEYDPIALWSFVKSIIVSSNATGIKNHFLLTNAFVSGQQNRVVKEPIIASFDVSINEQNRNSYLNYDPKFLIYNDVNNDTVLKTINFKFSYLTKDLNIFNLYLFPSQSSSIQLQYKHKTILS